MSLRLVGLRVAVAVLGDELDQGLVVRPHVAAKQVERMMLLLLGSVAGIILGADLGLNQLQVLVGRGGDREPLDGEVGFVT